MRERVRGFLNAGSLVTAVFLGVCLVCVLEVQGKDKEKGIVASLRDGKLERSEQNNWMQLGTGQEVLRGDRLRTDTTAVAIIEFPAVGRFVMGPSSHVELGKDPRDFRTKIERGALWLQSSLPKGSKTSITTSLATAGIRGTAFSMVFGEGEKLVCICTCSGDVEVSLKDGRTIRVAKGEYLAVPENEPAPVKAQTSLPLLEKRGTVFDFCFNCHSVGGKGTLKQGGK
ncbi:MAG: FecR family protein [Alphaproteobacteria bacterium]|uniref:FecR family protein n=1 Tax=Candidatus Nitrobium versatile TaxID=2884831 RepID=A0A953M285_9BACT|nr:FecR family protein [Candidatus Nitrobium versatile]